MPMEDRSLRLRQPARRSLLSALLTLAAAGLTSGRTARAAEAVGEVLSLRGDAQAIRNRERYRLALNSPLYINDLLLTGPAARLTARLGRSTRIRLGERVRLRLHQVLVEAGMELVIESGALLVEHEAAGGRLEMRTPLARIGVRGTRFFAGEIDDGFGVLVYEGEVTVGNEFGIVLLSPGQGTMLRPGEPPEPPKIWPPAKVARAEALVS